MAEFLDSEDSEFWIAEWERERNICPVHDGPMSECPDDERDWYPQRRICWPAAQLAAAKRLFELLHKDKPYHDGKEQYWSAEPSPLTPFHFLDGTRLYLAETDENPDDDFLGQRAGETRLLGGTAGPSKGPPETKQSIDEHGAADEQDQSARVVDA